MQRIATSDHTILPGGAGWGFRKLDRIESKALRLFILSLLWRAAASDMPEFKEVEIPNADLMALRSIIVDGSDCPISFYPATLIQISTVGEIHNQSPIAQNKIIPQLTEEPERTIPIFRFYFDGLIVHVHRHAGDDGYTQSLGSTIVGAERSLVVTTVTYDKSFQKQNIELIKSEAFLDWPAVIDKLSKERRSR